MKRIGEYSSFYQVYYPLCHLLFNLKDLFLLREALLELLTPLLLTILSTFLSYHIFYPLFLSFYHNSLVSTEGINDTQTEK